MAINFPAAPHDGDTHEGYVWVASESAWRRLPEAPSMDIENLNNVSVTTPADGESLVYDSATGEWINADATVEVYGVDTAATDYFMMPVGTEAQRPLSPANGYFRFNSDTGNPEWYSEGFSEWFRFNEIPTIVSAFEYLVVAGGGGGGDSRAGGGGAGGYRSSIAGETSGRNTTIETAPQYQTGDTFNITIGAGGANATSGSNSVFGTVTSTGGGRGGSNNGGGSSGGSGGGGAGVDGSGASGTAGQGFGGGNGVSGGNDPAGGGGGAGESGQTPANGSANAGKGGDGIASSVTGPLVYRAGGGGGGSYLSDKQGDGGLGGGGEGNGLGSGVTNTGGGGGGGRVGNNGTSGGSGVVILRYSSDINLNIGPGLSTTTSVVGNNKITQFLSGSDTVVVA